MVRRNAKHNIEKRNSILNLTDTAEGDMGDMGDMLSEIENTSIYLPENFSL